jgi:hypothetical protein
MKSSAFVHSTNFFLIILLIGVVAIGCKNTDSSNANYTTNEISGEVFPANEVCKYPDTPIIKKYGGFDSKWGKGDESVGVDFRYLCNPYPSKLIALLNEPYLDYREQLSYTKIQISYDARGNRPEGAHTIYMEYRAVTDENVKAKQLKKLDQKYRKDVVIPLFSEVVKKALKQTPSSKILQKIQSGKTGFRNMDSCEKLGNGFVCVDNFEKDESGFIELYIFANEEAIKAHFKEQGGL